MNIDRTLLDKIAHLSRLEFDEKDANKIMTEMSAIVTWIEQLNEINALREDEVKPHLPHDKALLNAPKKDADYFRVPKVLE